MRFIISQQKESNEELFVGIQLDRLRQSLQAIGDSVLGESAYASSRSHHKR